MRRLDSAEMVEIVVLSWSVKSGFGDWKNHHGAPKRRLPEDTLLTGATQFLADDYYASVKREGRCDTSRSKDES